MALLPLRTHSFTDSRLELGAGQRRKVVSD
jgi:hypothetical protein